MKRLGGKRTQTWVLLGLVALVISGWYWKASNSPLARDARHALDAMLANDSDGVYAFALSDEVAELGLTREKYRAFWDQLIRPRFLKVKVLDSPQAMMAGNRGLQAKAEVNVILPNGNKDKIGPIVNKSEAGGKILIIRDVLFRAWCLDYRGTHLEGYSTESLLLAKLSGLKQDQSKLEAIGIPGLYVAPGSPIKTWGELETTWNQQLAQERAHPYSNQL